VLESAADFVGPKAKHITGLALRALLAGVPAVEALMKYRKNHDDWLAAMPATVSSFEALYGARISDEMAADDAEN
jgi:hypothetical protein